jgi:DNA-binding beta-propeller fold protein YncE
MGAGTAWIVDAGGANIAAISSGGTPLSPDAVASVSNGGYSGNQALANGGTPTGIAVDPSGNVWVTQQNAGKPGGGVHRNRGAHHHAFGGCGGQQHDCDEAVRPA